MFNTKFSLASNKYKTYSRSDKVDRLTYVDPVLQVKNFFRAGSQTALNRGQFLYESADAALNEGDSWAVPVYQKDIVDTNIEVDRLKAIRQHYLSQYQSRLRESQNAYQSAHESPKVKVESPKVDTPTE